MKKTLILEYQAHSKIYSFRNNWYVCSDSDVAEIFPCLGKVQTIKMVISDSEIPYSVPIDIWNLSVLRWAVHRDTIVRTLFFCLQKKLWPFMKGDITTVYISIQPIERHEKKV